MTVKTGHLEVITKFVAAREKHPKAAMFALQAVSRSLLGDSRIKICYRYRIPDRNVEVWHNGKRSSAYYTGLMKCGLQWVCPLCSSRLSEKRREILRQALDNSRAKFVPVMVSYTCQHNQSDRLLVLLTKMLAAYRRMRQSRAWRTIKEEFLIVGECRTMEITHGDNGWHPHFHVLMFLDIAILPYVKDGETYPMETNLYEPIKRHITREWLEHLRHFGLDGQEGPALHVRGDWASLDDYLTKQGSAMPKQADKWGVAEEMSKAQRKKSRAGGVNVWDMLILHYAGVKPYGQLFLEYFEATKGKSMMQWSPGLLARLNVTEQNEDDMLQQEPEPGDLLLVSLSSEQWRVVLDAAAEGQLLDVAATGDYEKVATFLSQINAPMLI